MLDFKIGDTGELEYNHNTNDIYCVSEDSIIKQIATNRIKSIVGDWFNSNIGADLEDFIGKPNNTDTGMEVVRKIISSLTYDEFLKGGDLYLIPKIDKTVLSIKVFIKKQFGEDPMIIDVEIDLVSGVNVSSEINY